jgi:hypothetical protein
MERRFLDFTFPKCYCKPRKYEDIPLPSLSAENGIGAYSHLLAQYFVNRRDRLKGLSILDCVVVIDMCEFTPLLKIYSLEEVTRLYIQDEEAVTLSEKVMKRNKSAGALTVSFVGFSDTEGLNGNLMTFPPDTAPLIPAVVKAPDTEKWMAAQREVVRSSLGQGGAAQMQKNPRLWQAALMKTMKP